MPVYQYEALNNDGRTIRGKVTAENEREVQRNLKSQGLVSLSIEKEEKTKGFTLFKGGLKTQDHIMVLEELAVLLKAGVPLADGVESIASSGIHPDITTAFENINGDLKRGERFSVTLKKNLPKLPSYVDQLIAAGEITGNLESALADSAKQMQYDLDIKKDIRSALTYPAILIFVGIGAVFFIFTVVVPKFESLFEGKIDQLPGLARIVMGSGMYLRDNMYLVLGILVGFITLLVFLFRIPAVQKGTLEISQSIPIFGSWMKDSETGRWATLLAILMRNKIPLMQALELAKSGLKTPSVQQQMTQVAISVRAGASLANALRDHTHFAPISINLISVGEKAGNLAEMLQSLSTLYERSSKDRMQKFLALIEPLSIMIVGALIGSIVGGIIVGIQSVTDLQ
ncbi:MAG: type II secretion system F family protein [Alphaproteobacteria bacterium]|jgi:general secretion pathway protein F|nr:type II secretion system F family protein [Alphaproteobacteria bacterium]